MKITIEISDSMHAELRFLQEEKQVKYGTIIDALCFSFFWHNDKLLNEILNNKIHDWNGKLEEEILTE